MKESAFCFSFALYSRAESQVKSSLISPEQSFANTRANMVLYNIYSQEEIISLMQARVKANVNLVNDRINYIRQRVIHKYPKTSSLSIRQIIKSGEYVVD